MAAAFEGSLQGAQAAAFSLHPKGDLAVAEAWIERFLRSWDQMVLPPQRIWNVNLPKREPKGFKLTTQDTRSYHDVVERRVDPRGTPYYWIGGDVGPIYAKSPGSDAEAALDDYVSVTPLHLDLTAPDLLARRAHFDTTFNGNGA